MGIRLPSLNDWSTFCESVQENHDLICLTTESGYRQYRTMTVEEYKNFKSGWHNCCHKLSLGEIVSTTKEIFKSSTGSYFLKSHFKFSIIGKLARAFSDETKDISELANQFLNSCNESVKEYQTVVSTVETLQAHSKTKKEAGYAASKIGKIVWFFWNLIWNQETNVTALRKQVPDEQGMRKLICHAIRFQIDMDMQNYEDVVASRKNTTKLKTSKLVSTWLSNLPETENSEEASLLRKKIETYNKAWEYYNSFAESKKEVERKKLTIDSLD